MTNIRSENLQTISQAFQEVEELDSRASNACRQDAFRVSVGSDRMTGWLSVEERAVLRGLLLGNWHSRISLKVKQLEGMGVQFDDFAARDAWIAEKLTLLPEPGVEARP